MEDPTGSTEYPTRVAKFQGVSSLTMHFPSNYGGDCTRLWRAPTSWGPLPFRLPSGGAPPGEAAAQRA